MTFGACYFSIFFLCPHNFLCNFLGIQFHTTQYMISMTLWNQTLSHHAICMAFWKWTWFPHTSFWVPKIQDPLVCPVHIDMRRVSISGQYIFDSDKVLTLKCPYFMLCYLLYENCKEKLLKLFASWTVVLPLFCI